MFDRLGNFAYKQYLKKDEKENSKKLAKIDIELRKEPERKFYWLNKKAVIFHQSEKYEDEFLTYLRILNLDEYLNPIDHFLEYSKHSLTIMVENLIEKEGIDDSVSMFVEMANCLFDLKYRKESIHLFEKLLALSSKYKFRFYTTNRLYDDFSKILIDLEDYNSASMMVEHLCLNTPNVEYLIRKVRILFALNEIHTDEWYVAKETIEFLRDIVEETKHHLWDEEKMWVFVIMAKMYKVDDSSKYYEEYMEKAMKSTNDWGYDDEDVYTYYKKLKFFNDVDDEYF